MSCLCAAPAELAEQQRKSKKIDVLLREEKLKRKRQLKILVLGSGESGKSTFIKQMRIIHGEDFAERDRQSFLPIIFENILTAAKTLVKEREKLQIPWGNSVSESHARLISSADNTEEDVKLYVEALTHLWSDSGIRETYRRRSQFLLGDSTAYFFDRLPDIGKNGYVPSKQDILCVRSATRGVTEYDIWIKSIPFMFVDVGGQRSQRTKWYQCFQEVGDDLINEKNFAYLFSGDFNTKIASVLFVVATNGFDKVLAEDRRTNRLVESINLFESVVKNPSFQGKVSFLLFLNKMDLLEEKVKHKNIREYFPAFPEEKDPHNVRDVQDFLVGEFSGKCDRLQYHFTTATDTENIRRIFESVRLTLLEGNLRHYGLY